MIFDGEAGRPADIDFVLEAVDYVAHSETLQLAYIAVGDDSRAVIWEDEARVWKQRLSERVDAHPLSRTVNSQATQYMGECLARKYINLF